MKKTIFTLALSGVTAFSAFAGPAHSTSSFKLPSYSAPSFKMPTLSPAYKPAPSFKMPTYRLEPTYATRRTVGTYATTGLPRVERSQPARREFLKQQGFSRTPPGCEVHHVVALHHGGADTPANMQLLSKAEHQRITITERQQDGSLYIHR